VSLLLAPDGQIGKKVRCHFTERKKHVCQS
jgi:hypothetical protein